MKKILLCLALFCLATGPISCGDSNTDDGTEQGGGGNGGDGGGTGPEPEPGNPEITPEQHKAKLETIGKEVAAQFNPEDSKAAIESLTALEELLAFDDEDVAPSPAPKTYAVATAKSLAAVAAGPDVHALTSLIVRATTTEKYTLDEWAGDYVIEDGEPVKKGRIVIATVKGDIHDIGKNIVRVILENYGFEVLDLGRDVPVETVVDTVREKDVHLVGLSALMTTTLKSMEETIAALHAAKLDCKIMVGGAVLTPEYAEKIGADWYAKDAKRSADIAKEFFGV